MKYATFQALEGEFTAGLMCRCLPVSRGGYYPWQQRPAAPRQQVRQALEAEVQRVFEDEQGRPAPRASPAAQGQPQHRGRHHEGHGA